MGVDLVSIQPLRHSGTWVFGGSFLVLTRVSTEKCLGTEDQEATSEAACTQLSFLQTLTSTLLGQQNEREDFKFASLYAHVL